MSANDTAFQFAASNLRFGTGITHEVGDDLADLRVKRTLLLVDPALRDSQ
jgi:hydroxyacid-oxoacid transhydrogenase